MSIRIDHANLNVRDLDAMIQFLRTAFPSFRLRAEGRSWRGTRWVHLGTDDTYLALSEVSGDPAEPWIPYSNLPGTNHLGYEVEDVEALRQRMSDAGYEESTVPNAHPHRRRVYFHDPEGRDWEFIQYFSDDPAQRNDYALGD